MQALKKIKAFRKSKEDGCKHNWKTQRYLIEDDWSYQLDNAPEPKAIQVKASAIIYGIFGVLSCITLLAQAGPGNPGRFLLYLACASLAAFGLTLTSSKNVLSAGFLFLMLSISDLSLPEALFVAISITLQREALAVRRFADLRGLLFAVASVTIGIMAAQTTYVAVSQLAHSLAFPTAVIASAGVLMTNFVLAAMLWTNRKESWYQTFQRECEPLLPWFIVTAYVVYLVDCAAARTGYHPALIALPLLFTIDFGYRAWCDQLEGSKEEIAQLHRNTLETLALAIDARDQTTHMHLRRVQIYALAIGRELGLSEAELEALYISALLHDIGKLGIPDHILLKPGSLTAPEWEKMKSHTVIGAEMLIRMRFPDLVSSIVITHHEKWDGTGYPNRLNGTRIPIGSRILSAVDCLDALASDRPYRAALPLEEAMDMVRQQAGKAYDPAIIAILEQRYVELDQLAREIVGHPAPTSETMPAQHKGIANLANHLLTEAQTAIQGDILNPIVSARQEDQLLKALASDLARSARLEEVFAAIHDSLSPKISYDTMALYVRRHDDLEPVQVLGGHESLFSRSRFPMERGLSGWVAQHGTPILNGNVSLESCYRNDSDVLTNLQSALAVPFVGKGGTMGVLTLYHLDRNAFGQDDLRILEAASAHIGPAVEGALHFLEAEETAATDHLTGVANARGLAAYLDRELQRASRDQSTVGVLVCDLDGFKHINDSFGHLTGDEVLRTVATGLRKACRGSDFVARIGGDEFIIVLPGLRDDYSAQLERLRDVAVEAGLAACGERCLSMSVGMAVYPADGPDAETLIASADQRMYRIKHRGTTKGEPSGRDPEPAENRDRCEAARELEE